MALTAATGFTIDNPADCGRMILEARRRRAPWSCGA